MTEREYSEGVTEGEYSEGVTEGEENSLREQGGKIKKRTWYCC